MFCIKGENEGKEVSRPAGTAAPDVEKKTAAPAGAAVWWERVDSNHRSRRQQIYSLPPLATRERSHIQLISRREVGAGRRTRTPDLLITNQLLYQLSYTSVFLTLDYFIILSEKSQGVF